MPTWLARIAIAAWLVTATLPAQQRPLQAPVFRAATDLITTTVAVRGSDGRFVADLRPEEFLLFEDGVPQKIGALSLTVGGRVVSDLTAAPTADLSTSGLLLPTPRRPADASGRVFIIFIDDMHLQAADSPRVRAVLRQVRDTVLHDGDLVAYVSTGYSSIESDLSYDYKFKRFNEAIERVMGSAPTTQQVIAANQTSQGPAGLRHNAHVAFSTAYDLLGQLAGYNLRRKAFIYVSNGYDFDPFKDARFKAEQEKYDMPLRRVETGEGSAQILNPFSRQGSQFAAADLVGELFELTRAAREANVTFYTLDPRGLTAGPDITDRLSTAEWRDNIRTTTSSLEVLGAETGGFCICGTNDFKTGLERIDNETSDYYVIGYVSTNPDPLRVRRTIEIRITRPNVRAIYVPVYRLNRYR